MLQEINFRNSTDTGEIDVDSIAPVSNGESATETTLRRPTENNRLRTEALKERLRDSILLHDIASSGTAVWGGGTITWGGAYSTYTGLFTLSADLYLSPFVTAGNDAAAPYIGSTPAFLKVGTQGNNQVIITSVQNQFEGSALLKADANRISVEILNDVSETIALEGATGDENNIKITIISGTTTAQGLIDLINNDVTVNQYVSAALESTSTGTNTASLWGPTQWGTDYSLRFLKGGLAGIVHKVTAANLASFFAADTENLLKKGDTLALWYDALIEAAATGGRFQSTPENANITIPAGSFFNTRREPEKAPGCIPICKCIDDDTILFVDGSYITRGTPATLKVDSVVLTEAENGSLATLSWARMGTGTVHNPPTTIREALDNADGLLDAALDEIEAARDSVTYGANASLDARLEALDLVVDDHTTEIVNARTSTTYGAAASIDARLEALDLVVDGHNDELVNARDSTAYLATYGSVDARLEASEQEIIDARTSTTYGAHASLDARLEALDLVVDGGTLQKAYDSVGSGAGRTINADNGAVTIRSTTSSNDGFRSSLVVDRSETTVAHEIAASIIGGRFDGGQLLCALNLEDAANNLSLNEVVTFATATQISFSDGTLTLTTSDVNPNYDLVLIEDSPSDDGLYRLVSIDSDTSVTVQNLDGTAATLTPSDAGTVKFIRALLFSGGALNNGSTPFQLADVGIAGRNDTTAGGAALRVTPGQRDLAVRFDDSAGNKVMDVKGDGTINVGPGPSSGVVNLNAQEVNIDSAYNLDINSAADVNISSGAGVAAVFVDAGTDGTTYIRGGAGVSLNADSNSNGFGTLDIDAGNKLNFYLSTAKTEDLLLPLIPMPNANMDGIHDGAYGMLLNLTASDNHIFLVTGWPHLCAINSAEIEFVATGVGNISLTAHKRTYGTAASVQMGTESAAPPLGSLTTLLAGSFTNNTSINRGTNSVLIKVFFDAGSVKLVPHIKLNCTYTKLGQFPGST